MIELKRSSVDDEIDIYNLLQDMPVEENGYHNGVNGISYEDLKNS